MNMQNRSCEYVVEHSFYIYVETPWSDGSDVDSDEYYVESTKSDSGLTINDYIDDIDQVMEYFKEWESSGFKLRCVLHFSFEDQTSIASHLLESLKEWKGGDIVRMKDTEPPLWERYPTKDRWKSEKLYMNGSSWQPQYVDILFDWR